MDSSPHPPAEPRAEWLRSLAFWLCLFAAAGLYGLVVLSPKTLSWLALKREYEANQWRLVGLERQVVHLRRVIAAQRSDREFVREQARTEFDIARPGQQHIPVAPHLTLQIGAAELRTAGEPAPLPPYAGLLARVAGEQRLADALLGAAAFLTLIAFGCLYQRRTGERGVLAP